MEPRYRTSAQILHWLIALLVIGLLTVGLILRYDLIAKSSRPTVLMLHMSIGLTVFFLMLLRLGVRLVSPVPPLPASVTAPIRLVAGATQILFYILLLAMPVFGVIFVQAHGFKVPYFDLFTLPALVAKNQPLNHWFAFLHFWGGITLIVLLVLHVAGAIRHQLRGERVLLRMMPRRSR
ncbi:cytochrome b [Acidiphilium sp.]|uniref:cytochrome b n=1 Tax=Acidiphilium sp. TaxID=527 RepID=UPI003D07D1DC